MLLKVAALVSFPVAGIKCPTAPRGRWCLFQPTVQGYSPILSGKLRQRRLEEAGHIPSTTRKRRVMEACCCSAPFSMQSRIQPGNGVAQSEWVPTSVRTIEIVSHRHAQRPISQIILDSVKITVNTSCLSGLTQVPSFFCLYPMQVHLTPRLVGPSSENG